MKKIRLLLTLICFVLVFVVAITAEALEPKLLWEKKLQFKINDIKMATESGDIILSSKEAKRIILYDRDGNERFHWGPRIDRLPFDVDIAANGDFAVYSTAWTDDYVWNKKIDKEKYGEDWRVHYVDRKGKEKWNKHIEGGVPYLSPDATSVAVGVSPAFCCGLTMLNSNGNILWRWGGEHLEIENIKFSPDSNYLAVSAGGVHLFSKEGEHLLEKGLGAILSISQNANSISIFDGEVEGVIFNKQGTVILNKKGILTPDGNKVLIIDSNKTTLIGLPTLEVLRGYHIVISRTIYPFINASISFNGNYLIIGGNKSSSENNLFVIDALADIIWEIKLLGEITQVFITSDGKYMLVVTDSNRLLYYQIY